MEKHRILLFTGAGLMVLSMPLVAFDVNWFGEMKAWTGGFVWLMSATIVLSKPYFHPIMLLYFIPAVLNLPQLVIPFFSNLERGNVQIFGLEHLGCSICHYSDARLAHSFHSFRIG